MRLDQWADEVGFSRVDNSALTTTPDKTKRSKLVDVFQKVNEDLGKDRDLSTRTYEALKRKCATLMTKGMGEEGSITRILKSFFSRILSPFYGTSVVYEYESIMKSLQESIMKSLQERGTNKARVVETKKPTADELPSHL